MNADAATPGLIEPPPLRFIARQAGYPWLIVGVACADAFIALLDASIVQLARARGTLVGPQAPIGYEFAGRSAAQNGSAQVVVQNQGVPDL